MLSFIELNLNLHVVHFDCAPKFPLQDFHYIKSMLILQLNFISVVHQLHINIKHTHTCNLILNDALFQEDNWFSKIPAVPNLVPFRWLVEFTLSKAVLR